MLIALLAVSLGIHEAAHGWVALKCGDPTARDMGRITLNPFAHIDPFMTILVPAILFMSVGMIFGGAKPVPVNFYNLRKPYRDMALVAIAGPLSNVLLAFLFYFFYHLVVGKLELWERGSLGEQVLDFAVTFNLLLAAFNMLPIPPLDGSRIMTFLLPAGSLRESYQRLESLGIILVIAFIWFVPGVQSMLWNTIGLMRNGVEYVVEMGGVW